jgi:hypothetical protein
MEATRLNVLIALVNASRRRERRIHRPSTLLQQIRETLARALQRACK